LTAALFGFVEETKEIPEEVRREADSFVKKIVDEGKAELMPGILFIDDAHLLDIESFAFLSRAMESEMAPIIILATNRGIAKIKGTDIESPHGIPRDVLDRLVIIRTRPYGDSEVREIIKIKAEEEGIKLGDDALERLTKIGAEESLRYAIQLLVPAYIRAKDVGRSSVTREDVEYAKNLFASLKESVNYVKQYEELFLK